MENSLKKYINSFNELEKEEKRQEIIKHFKELFAYLKTINNFDYPLYEDYESDDEFLTVAFTYLINIKELAAIAFDKNNDIN